MTKQNIKISEISKLADDTYNLAQAMSATIKSMSNEKHLNETNQKFVNEFITDMQKLQESAIALKQSIKNKPDYDGWLIPPRETSNTK